MATTAQIATRKAAAAAIINANSAALAALAGAQPLTLHAALQADDPQTAELLELLAQIVAAIVELSTP